ncbi:MAG: hypothetical protein AAFX03_10635 [Pseudomonadota bacterium]
MNTYPSVVASLACLFAPVLGSCAGSASPEPDLQILYERSAQYHMPDRNPVIVIPGILGSKLVDGDTGQVVWGAFDPEAVDPETPAGARLISLPIDGDRPLTELQDSVRADGVLDRVRVRFFGVPIEIRAYAGILASLGVGGYRDESLGLNAIDYGDDHFTCFQFAYDWRRDNVENAQRLAAFIAEKKAYVEAIYEEEFGIEDPEVRFDIVAHSMGGLVGRYFMRYGDADLPADGSLPEVTWAGADMVERLIVIGAPNAGALNAFTLLTDGYDGGPFLPNYQGALLGTFPSVYQMLPRPRHSAILYGDSAEAVDVYDPAVWERHGWGLSSQRAADLKVLEAVLPDIESNAARREDALLYQARMLKRAREFHRALDAPAPAPERAELFLVAGDSTPTLAAVAIDRETGAHEPAGEAPGDGTVLRSSALLDERRGGAWKPYLDSPVHWSSIMFLFADHLGLTRDPAFTDNVLYWLLEDPRARTRPRTAMSDVQTPG